MKRIALFSLFALSACGLGDSAQVECRCGEDMLEEFIGDCVEEELTDPTNPLTSRLPECPSGTKIFLRERTTPFVVLFNVETTYENKSPSQYMEQLSDDFIFIPDPLDIDLHPEVFEPPPNYDPVRDTLWAWEDERTFIRELLDPDFLHSVNFVRWYESSKDQVEPSEDGLSELYIFPYEIDFQERPVDGVVETFGLKGRLEVILVTPTTENPLWTIQRMVDIRDAATAKRSLGELRAEFGR